MKKVFVTYAWGTQEENERVYSFVNMLRENGYDATCDQKEMQESTAPSFTQMMSRGLQSDKVIVILSAAYKRKADEPMTGVSREYEIIASEWRKPENNRKFIFVSFEGCSQERLDRIVPIMFTGIKLIDLAEDEKKGFRELYSCLNEVLQIEFGEVKEKTPDLQPRELPKFSLGHVKTLTVYKQSDDACVSRDDLHLIYEWLVDEAMSFKVKIRDCDIEEKKAQREKLQERAVLGERLSKEEDQWFAVINAQIKREEASLGNKEKALEIFFSHREFVQYMGYKTAENLCRIVKAVVQPSGEEEGTVTPVSVELFYDGEDKEKIVPGFFGVAIEGAFLDEIFFTVLQRREAGIWDVGTDNVSFRILPKMLYFLAEHGYEAQEELRRLEDYRMGLA